MKVHELFEKLVTVDDWMQEMADVISKVNKKVSTSLREGGMDDGEALTKKEAMNIVDRFTSQQYKVFEIRSNAYEIHSKKDRNKGVMIYIAPSFNKDVEAWINWIG